MEDRFEKFTYLVFKISKLIQRIKNIEMEALGLKAVHVMCIYYLSKSTTGLTSKQLVDLTLEDKAAISRALALLKEEGYVDYDSKYNALIKLTKKGQEASSYIKEKSEEALNEIGLDISEDERRSLYYNLKKIEGNIEIFYNSLVK